jgi:aerobic-type carbon monoxide dehydrogenase small subunit (CoxS/CutS family)
MKLSVNGKAVQVPDTMSQEPLLWALHDHLQLNSARYGCGAGLCGCCTVLLDGQVARSCQTTVQAASVLSVRTLEGLTSEGQLHPVQQAFFGEPFAM